MIRLSISSQRLLALVGFSVVVFVVCAVMLLRLVPGPHTEGDYLIIGCVSTLGALLSLFLILILTSGTLRAELFFKRRRR